MRRMLWAAIGVLTVMVLVGGGVLTWLVIHRTEHLPTRLLVSGTDARMRLLDNGTEQVLDTNVPIDKYRFPAVAPDGSHIAYIATEGSASIVYRLDLNTGTRNELHRSSLQVPFDLAWSPDGRNVLFLAADNNGISTFLVPADGSQPATLIVSGNTSYFAWSADGSKLLLHQNGHMAQGGSMQTYTPGASRPTSVLNDTSFFQAPAWALDGAQFFYVAQPPSQNAQLTFADVESALVRVDADGHNPRTLASEKQAGMRIVRAPSSNTIAYSVQPYEETGMYTFGALKLLDDATGQSRVLSAANQKVVSFYWSSDGSRIAYITLDALTDTARFSWHVVDVASGAIVDLNSFTPNDTFTQLQSFFDAFAYGINPWSPDNTQLAYGANDGVYTVNVAGGDPTRVGDGEIALWTGGR